MYIDPTVYQGRPSDDRIPQELAVYDKLEELGISFTRVDHDHADTMEDCLLIERTLGARICKNLFLCNRQQTDFYLLMMPGDKPFKTKDLSPLLGCSRLSFAGPEHMERLLRTIPGSVSALELMFDTQGTGTAGHRPGPAEGPVSQRTPGDLHLHPVPGAGGDDPLRGGHRPYPHLSGPAGPAPVGAGRRSVTKS